MCRKHLFVVEILNGRYRLTAAETYSLSGPTEIGRVWQSKQQRQLRVSLKPN